MKLINARPKLRLIENIPFSTLYRKEELEGIIIAKGNTGKLLEKIIGLPAGNSLQDFEDGELKTNKARANGAPMETMFISQISTRVDELLNQIEFKDSWIFKKIGRMIYVPVVKESTNPDNWYFLPHFYIEIIIGSELFKQLNNDFQVICSKMIDDIENQDGSLHTSSGDFIQIRTKDAMPYNPIFSKKYNKKISNKNFAFYFKKEFMIHIQKNYAI